MKKSTIKSIVVLSFTLFCFGIYAQSSSKIWTPVSERTTESKVKEYRNSVPMEYKLYSLNSAALHSALNNAPARAHLRTSSVIIELPVASGEMQRFKVADASTFAPELQQKHPNIRSFAGQGIDDPTAIARFSTSPNGVHVMISSAKHATFYMDPYTQDKQAYIGYSRESLPAPLEPLVCLVEEEVGPRPNTSAGNGSVNKNANDGMLRTFRLALASNAEYSYYHWFVQAGIDPGAPDAEKKAAVLAAMNVAMTRVNGIFERDVALTMEIVPDNEDIIFLDTTTDGLSNDSGMINQIQPIIDNAIGFANYDIGHVFSTGGGGIAQLRSPCTASKARGVTGLPQPIGDPFYVDYVSHEMGHQYGGNHTQNNNCQRSASSYEPGSASTIMGYAGICPPNVQNASDDYFHAISIQEMWSNITAGQSQCAAQTETGNLPPTADAGINYTIPKSTPFILRGTGADPDTGDILSHCWEQMNNQIAPMPPQNTSTVGPAFRSIDPLATPDRYMPALATVLNGQTQSTWEVVPAVGRTMIFRYTVRDNFAGGGSSASDNTVITTDGTSGPFVITSQNTDPIVWLTQTTQTITWDVAGSDVAPVDSPLVDILFSTDGGLTYPVSIALNVPNNGSALINVPNLNTTAGRIMVISSNNIFYDVNNEDIVVQGPLGTEEFAFDNFAVYPNPSTGTFNVTFKPASNDNIGLSLYDLRGRLINENSYDNVSTGNTFTKTLNYDSIESGMYFLVVKNGNKTTTKKLIKM